MKEIKGKCLLDTNVLIYATLESDARFKISQTILLSSSQAQLFVSTQNLAELYPNLTGPKMQNPDRPEIARASSITLLNVRFSAIEYFLALCKTFSSIVALICDFIT